MSYLLDTNVLSELRRKLPDPAVLNWFSQRPAGTLYLSVLTLGEIRKGVEALADTPRRLALLDWLETELPAFFSGRILPIDVAVADRWGRMVAMAGRPLPAIDSLLAATAAHHGFILVTRNLRNVKGLGVQVLDPWAGSNVGRSPSASALAKPRQRPSAARAGARTERLRRPAGRCDVTRLRWTDAQSASTAAQKTAGQTRMI